MDIARNDHWNEHARRWSHFGAPLRPLPEDVAVAEALAAGLAAARAPAPLRAVLLGVTPELAGMRWPAGTRLRAVDRCEGMIAGVWPRDHVPAGARADAGDWSALPLPDGGADLVLGDGCYVLLPVPGGYDAVSAEVARVLAPHGRYLMRLFVRPEQQESPGTVLSDLAAGRIGSFHAFKWRLAMALHGDLAGGVRVGEVWQRWHDSGIDPLALQQRHGWSAGSIATIDGYRGVDTRYHFPTLAEARAHLSRWFRELECHQFDYELGERCPTLVMAPR